MNDLTHFDSDGNSRMVDVGGKTPTVRTAVAGGKITMKVSTLKMIMDREITKGDVFGVARLAGIMAAKKTADLIPLCHPLALTHVEVDFETHMETGVVDIRSRVGLTGVTGVEMEALTAVSVAALTVYDMCKAVDKGMLISDICLLEKMGGKSGTYRR